ncbi:ABC transporter permease [Microbacterium pumilum]|uniref:Autoinducer 2 import system permease protein LsrD n=1 Tax=Microbacterium pumilum TaxID=344165 RepID=A0ABP5EEA1_9MICO
MTATALRDDAIDSPHEPTVAARIWTGVSQNSITSVTITLVIVLIVGALWAGPIFLSASNLGILASSVAIPLIVGSLAAIGLLGGALDLSIGAHIGFGAALFSAQYAAGAPIWQAMVVTVIASVLIGVVNAFTIVFCKGNPITITLGMLVALHGAALVALGKPGQISAFIPALYAFTAGRVGPFPTLFLIGVVLVVFAAVVMGLTRLGRHIRAVGGDPRASERAGLKTNRIVVGLYILVALGAGFGGVLYAGALGGASATLGVGLEFQIYAGVLIGGFSLLRGGVGNPIGGAIGLIVIAAVDNMLRLNGADINVAFLVLGLLLLGAILLDRVRGGERFE